MSRSPYRVKKKGIQTLTLFLWNLAFLWSIQILAGVQTSQVHTRVAA